MVGLAGEHGRSSVLLVELGWLVLLLLPLLLLLFLLLLLRRSILSTDTLFVCWIVIERRLPDGGWRSFSSLPLNWLTLIICMPGGGRRLLLLLLVVVRCHGRLGLLFSIVARVGRFGRVGIARCGLGLLGGGRLSIRGTVSWPDGLGRHIAVGITVVRRTTGQEREETKGETALLLRLGRRRLPSWMCGRLLVHGLRPTAASPAAVSAAALEEAPFRATQGILGVIFGGLLGVVEGGLLVSLGGGSRRGGRKQGFFMVHLVGIGGVRIVGRLSDGRDGRRVFARGRLLERARLRRRRGSIGGGIHGHDRHGSGIPVGSLQSEIPL